MYKKIFLSEFTEKARSRVKFDAEHDLAGQIDPRKHFHALLRKIIFWKSNRPFSEKCQNRDFEVLFKDTSTCSVSLKIHFRG